MWAACVCVCKDESEEVCWGEGIAMRGVVEGVV